MPDYTMKNFYDAEQFSDGVEYASNPDIRVGFTEWDYFFYTRCMYKLKRFSECLEVFKEFHEKYPESDILNDVIGWSLYYVHIRDFDYEHGDKKRFFSQVDYILAHSSNTQHSPKKRVAIVAADAVFNRKLARNPDYKLGNKYLSMIDPLMLDTNERVIDTGDRTVRILSEREQWYIRKTKALLELEEYEQCLAYIDEAFKNVSKFHNNNEHWLNYRKAKCYMAYGDVEGAENIIKSILASFQHWCFYEVLFNAALAHGNTEEAIRFGAFAASFDKEHKLRVSFYENYAEFLLRNGYAFEAALHYKLVEIIREEESWKSIRLPDGFSYPADFEVLDKNSILRKLEVFWNTEKERGINYCEGTVVKILPNGKSGFIKDISGNSYYFNTRDFIEKVRDLQEGARVRFTLAERLDKTKNEVKLNAVQISFIR